MIRLYWDRSFPDVNVTRQIPPISTADVDLWVVPARAILNRMTFSVIYKDVLWAGVEYSVKFSIWYVIDKVS